MKPRRLVKEMVDVGTSTHGWQWLNRLLQSAELRVLYVLVLFIN
jgi:hypothetical protein